MITTRLLARQGEPLGHVAGTLNLSGLERFEAREVTPPGLLCPAFDLKMALTPPPPTPSPA